MIKNKYRFSFICIFISLLWSFCWTLSDSFQLPQPKGLARTRIAELARIRFNSEDDDEPPMLGKVVVITGAAGGIGRELSNILYSIGATIVALDRNENGLKEMKNSIPSNDTRFFSYVMKQEDLNSVAEVADRIQCKFETIDILINNAGLGYTEDYVLGSQQMMSAHGKDLCFTVNYLSHFLFTEKLIPSISNSNYGRIVHLTSTFSWKVDGSALLPNIDGKDKDPIAYRSDPEKQHFNHVDRSYAISKFAQIWHSRSIHESTNCASVCACPTWAATGIAGKENEDFLKQFAFPVSNCGPGVTSALNAILRTDGELGDALNDGKSFVANSRIIEYIRFKDIWYTSKFITNTWILRDIFTNILAFIILLGQRYTHEEFIIQQTSPESFNDEKKRKLFHQWSLNEVKPWL